MEENEEVEMDICWQDHNKSLLSVFDLLLSNSTFVDITIACEGKHIQAHKLILAACSDYFQEILSLDKNPHPIIYLKDVKHSHMLALLDHMYRGHFRVRRDELPDLIHLAEGLKIHGIGDTLELISLEEAESKKEGCSNLAQTETDFTLLPSYPSSSTTSHNEPPVSTQQETNEEIPLLFYTELLQNLDMQELLAGKITECLDSKNAKSDGDEVVKAVSSIAEKEIVDTFFKDFFEIELGVRQMDESVPVDTLVASSNNSTAVPEAETGEVDQIETCNSNGIPIIPASETQSVLGVSGKVEENLGSIVCQDRPNVIVTPSTTVPVASNHDISGAIELSNTNVLSMRTVITVVQDGFRTAKEDLLDTSGSALLSSVQAKSKRKNKYYRRHPIIPPVENSRIDRWSLLGRRPINPKIPEDVSKQEIIITKETTDHQTCLSKELNTESNDVNYRLQKVMPQITPPSNQLKTSSNEGKVQSPVIRTPQNSPSRNETIMSSEANTDSPQIAAPQHSCRDHEIKATAPRGAESANSVTTTVCKLDNRVSSKRRPLRISLIQTARKLLEAEVNRSPHITPFTSLEKPNIESSGHFTRQKSFSTPRKRSRHVRNLQFKTPPTRQLEGPHDTALSWKSQGSLNREMSSVDMRSRKKLEWTRESMSGFSGFSMLERIEEGLQETSSPVKTSYVNSTPTKTPYIDGTPAKTPRIPSTPAKTSLISSCDKAICTSSTKPPYSISSPVKSPYIPSSPSSSLDKSPYICTTPVKPSCIALSSSPVKASNDTTFSANSASSASSHVETPFTAPSSVCTPFSALSSVCTPFSASSFVCTPFSAPSSFGTPCRTLSSVKVRLNASSLVNIPCSTSNTLYPPLSPVSMPYVPASPLRTPWIPPPTPRILSPGTRFKIYGSPVPSSPRRVSPEGNYFLNLRRLLGSPLAPGTLPLTPGPKVVAIESLAREPSPSDLNFKTPMHSQSQAMFSGTPSSIGSLSKFISPFPSSFSIRIPPATPEEPLIMDLRCDEEITLDDDGPPVLTPTGTPKCNNSPYIAAVSPRKKKIVSESLKRLAAESERSAKDSQAIDVTSRDENAVARPPKKRRRLPSQGSENEAHIQMGSDQLMENSVFQVPKSTRILRPRKNSGPISPKAPTSQLSISDSHSKGIKTISPRTKARVPALTKRTIPFPKTGFPFTPVQDERNRILIRVGGRQKSISMSKKMRLISIHSPPSPIATPTLSQLLKTPNKSITFSETKVERVSYNKAGKMVKLTDEETNNFTFDDHLRVLLQRGREPVCGGVSKEKAVERES